MLKTIFEKLQSIKYLILLLCISIYSTLLIGELFYNSVYSPDFSRYKIYMDYFIGNTEKTFLEQNLSYFFIQSFVFSLKNEILFEYNFDSLLDSSILMTNNFLYLIGLIGIYKVFTVFGFDKKDILITLTLLNFFPPVFGMRLVFKPEIFVFALLPWIIYSIELFIKLKKELYLYIFYFLSIFLFTIKPTSTAMCGLFLLIRYRNTFLKLGIKKILISLIFVLIVFIPLMIEDYEANGNFYFFHESNGEYVDKPDFSFLYKVNILELKEKPIKNNHANSLIGIILLDTFGDYFEVLWENDRSLFKFNKINLGENFFINNYLRKYIGIFFTVAFYLSSIFYLFKSKKFKDFYFLPFYGIITLLVVSFTGNFQKDTGDVMKSHYYGFFLALTFCFLILNIFKKISLENKIFYSILFIFSNLFIFGLPKESSPNYFEYLNANNVSPLACNINQLFISNGDNNCKNYVLNICNFDKSDYKIDYIRDLNYSKFNEDDDLNLPNRETIYEKKLQKNDLVIKVFEKKECFNNIKNGFYPIKKNFKISNFPYINMSYLVISFFAIIHLYILKTKNFLFHSN